MIELEDTAKGQGADARHARRMMKRRAAALAGGRSSDSDFAPLDMLLDRMGANLHEASRRELGRAIATDLRGANARRIRANVTPEGAAMPPRKAKKSGGARTKKLRQSDKSKKSEKMGRMFERATAPRYLRRESSQGEAQVGFVGAMARIMRVHHFGLRDTVTRDPSSPEVTYPERVILGLTPDDRLRILALVEAAVAP